VVDLPDRKREIPEISLPFERYQRLRGKRREETGT
jgi:hypothetical protein